MQAVNELGISEMGCVYPIKYRFYQGKNGPILISNPGQLKK
jgi:hypothetical protein